MKFLLFGTGEYYTRYKKWFPRETILALLDNSSVKQNTMLDGIQIFSPAEGIKFPYDCIVILSFYVKDMKRQLIDLGVEEQKIYHFYDLRKLECIRKCKQEIQLYGIDKKQLFHKVSFGEDKKKVVLLSTDLALGGTAIALFHMAELLRKRGYNVVFASMVDGPLREKIRSCDIPVIVDPNLQVATMQEIEWVQGFQLIVCNAINYYIFLSERNKNIPTMWWLHDSTFFYDGVDKSVLKGIVMENMSVLSVGPIPAAAMRRHVPDMPIRQLLYGVRDAEAKEKNGDYRRDKTCFVVIGHIEERKGQDILLQAVSILEEDVRGQAEFYLVGPNTSLMARQIMEQVAHIPEIVITGAVDRIGINRILQRADMLICPSREDPMPTVAAEAMMHGVPCLVSDATGTASYINRGENGDVFETGNAIELSEKLKWYINHYDILKKMGERARKVYESFFSMKTFENNLMAEITRLWRKQ